jgi:protein farnesyltransferase subunit beta
MSLTPSQLCQEEMRLKVSTLFSQLSLDLSSKTYSNFVHLNDKDHCEFSQNGLIRLPRQMSSLSSGQPWLMFWNLNVLNILNYPIEEVLTSQILKMLSQCKCFRTGAFCGGPYQDPHLAPTYATLCALISLDQEAGYDLIDTKGIYDFLISMKKTDPLGAFSMHRFGENDMRSVYCAICVASILDILDDRLTENVADHIASCQNFDGGFGAEPFAESHGGYTYCAVASLVLMKETHKVDLLKALEWCLTRQMDFEGGFNGRPNKIVDSCYTFWIGACIRIIQNVLNVKKEIVDCQRVQAYVLVACQSVMGFFDKPGSRPDYYHTCYALSGLSFFK